MRVIGTAGHVDHGKSTLVQALTGTHPDRLKEEQEREMTIDLGFAWMTMPDGEEVGIVDVPGHQDFIENMVAGVGGMDAVLFVIAADEGVMPQTREHLSIINLLGVPTGIIVFTKIDLVEDPEWIDLLEEDVRETFAGTVLESAPMVRVSTRTKQGIPELITLLATALATQQHRPNHGRPRLPIDRVFTIAGFGTVVTGTLLDGVFSVGDEIVVLPSKIPGRIRGLQTHKRKTTTAVPGSRVAMNLAGINMDEVRRGDVIALPGTYTGTQRLDVQFSLLPEVHGPLRHNTEVKFFLGTSEVIARVRLLGAESLMPGDSGWLQLELQQPVITGVKDRFILRRPSPSELLGGGSVIDVHPARRHKRFADAVLMRLDALTEGTPQDLVEQALATTGIIELGVLRSQLDLPPAVLIETLRDLQQQLKIVSFDSEQISAKSASNLMLAAYPWWRQITRQIMEIVGGYHQSYPLRQGIPREELKSRLKLAPKHFNIILTNLSQGGEVAEHGTLIAKPEFRINYSPSQKKAIDQLFAQFSSSPFSPPSVKDCLEVVGEEVFASLVDSGELIQVSADVVFRSVDYNLLKTRVLEILSEKKTITVSEMRDMVNTSRRYVLAFLEYMDSIGITVRDGDFRRLKSR